MMTTLITKESLDELSNTLSDQEIGAIYGVSYTRIWELRKKFGVRSFYQKHNGLKKNPRTGEVTYGGKDTIQFDERFFQSIDTEAKAYFLGFLAADGHVRKNHQCVQLALQEKDSEIVYLLAEHLGLDRSRVKFRVHKEKFNMAELYLSSRFMCEDLVRLGLGHDKSFTLYITPELLPREMVRHFIRGYADGDGTFQEFDLRIYTASQAFAMQLMDWLAFPGSTPTMEVRTEKRKNNLYQIRLGKRMAKAGLCWLYENQSICLKRKFAQFSRFYS